MGVVTSFWYVIKLALSGAKYSPNNTKSWNKLYVPLFGERLITLIGKLRPPTYDQLVIFPW